MQLKGIEYFVAIVENGSFSAASEKLFISQPALSQQIKKLEDEMGTSLFDRSRHPVQLTESGELFLREGKRILQIYNQLLRNISLLENSTEEIVHFGISPFYSRHYLPFLLSSLISTYPAIKYEIMEEYSYLIEQALIDGKLDFCLVPLLPQSPFLSYEPIYRETILLAVSRDNPINDLAIPAENGLPYMDLQNVQNEPFIALKSVQKFTNFSKELCARAGFVPNIVCETMNWDALNMLVSTGLGIGFVPDMLVDQLDEGIRPCYYRLSPQTQRVYTIAHRQGDTLPKPARLMVEVFREAFQKRASGEL